MTRHSISVITLVRNNLEYLRQSIGSLIAQTTNRWESIIVNDGSQKSIIHEDFLSREDIQRFAHKIRIINLDSWRGLIKCHKIGVINATKDVVGVLDCDDALDRTALEKVLDLYDRSEDAVFVYTNFWYCDGNLSPSHKGYAAAVKHSLLNERRGNHFRTFKKKHYFLTSGYDDDLIFGAEDQDILFKLEVFCRPVFLDECLYLYRRGSDESMTSSLRKPPKYCYNLSVLKNIMARYGNMDSRIKIYNSEDHPQYIAENNLHSASLFDDGKSYFFQLQSNGINLQTMRHEGPMVGFYDTHKKTRQDEFNISLGWDNINNEFCISERASLRLESFRIIHPNTYFDEVYVVNMPHEIDKRLRMQRIFGNYGIKCSFVEAIDGHDHKYAEEIKKTSLKSAGAYGYSLSMVKVFKDAILKGHKKILVCDDDIILCRDFLKKFDECARSVPYTWKVLFFGISGPWSLNVNTFLYDFRFDKRYTTNMVGCDGSFCVGYDRSVFENIIQTTLRLDAPFDTAMIGYLNNNPYVEKYAFYPQIVIADTLKESTINNYQENMGVMQNFMRNQMRFMVNIDDFDLDSMLKNDYKILRRHA